MKKKKKKIGDEPPYADMVSFASLMTILLAFFIMLSTYAGNPEEELADEAIESFKAALQNFGLSNINYGSSDSISNLIIALKRTGGRANKGKDQVMQKTFANLIDKNIEITYKRKKEQLLFPTEIDFVNGSLELTPSSMDYINNLIKLLKDRDFNIAIHGYTGKEFVPSEEFPNSWQSSAEHAAAVARYINKVANIDYERLTVVGYGKYQSLWEMIRLIQMQ